ncbi:MAG: hypothetical protein WBM14_12600 [Terracidiphilus sp.]
MRAYNKEQLLLGSVMHFRGAVFILAFNALISGVIGCSSQNSRLQPAPFTIFDERPFQMNCADRPSPLPPGARSFAIVSPQAPYARTRIDTLNVPRYQVPALTIAAESLNWVQIASANQDHWTVQFCAVGEGNTVEEASSYMQRVSMERTGSLLTLSNTDARGLTGGHGNLLLTAPAGAPVTVHSDAAVEVHDMAGPVRVSALGRAVILNTTGRVDALAENVDFAGSQGSVSLNASWDIDIKLTATKFRGNLAANAQRQVHALFPPGFQTPIEILVNRPKDFVCRADFCSKMRKDRVNFLYRFSYGNVANVSDHIGLRSENSQVTLDTTQ